MPAGPGLPLRAAGRLRWRLAVTAVLGVALLALLALLQPGPGAVVALSGFPVDGLAGSDVGDTAAAAEVESAAPAIPSAVADVRSVARGGQVATLRKGFERAQDLYLYRQSILPAATAGDADAMWMLSRVTDYCAGYATNPAGYARDTHVLAGLGLRRTNTLVAARDRVAARCRRFAPVDGLGYGLVMLQRLQAAEAGSLAAEAALLAAGEPLEESDEYRHELVERVRHSRDPEAFFAVAPAMGLAASGQPAHQDQVAGTVQAELAWQLSACRLGADCSATSALVTAQCANGGVCLLERGQNWETFVADAERDDDGKLDEMIDSLLGEGVLR